MIKTYILNFLKAHKEELKKRHRLIEIGLFGNYSKLTTFDEIKRVYSWYLGEYK